MYAYVETELCYSITRNVFPSEELPDSSDRWDFGCDGMAVGRDNAEVWTRVGQNSVCYATSGTGAAVFCHQYFAELSINCWLTCPKSWVIIFISNTN